MIPTQPERKTILLTSADSESRVEMTFVNIPTCHEGFLMGSREQDESELPIHRVVIPEDFWLGETPVTQAQFDAWPGAKQRGEDHWPSGNPNHPANNLSWDEAMEFCNWLTKAHAGQFPEGMIPAELPCKARWEYACRAGTTTDFHTGDGIAALREAGWYDKNS